MLFFKFFGTYMELIQTVGFQCKAESENLLIDVHGNVAGDILVFIGPNSKTSSAGSDIMELMRSDTKLEVQWKLVVKSLKYKFIALALIPKFIAWMFNAVILYLLYFQLPFHHILTVIGDKYIITDLLYRLPLVLPLLTLFYGKAIGFSLLKPLLFVITRLSRLSRIIFRRKVA